MTASDLVNVIEGAYNLVQLGQLDNHVGVTTGDDRVSQRIGIGQGLALAILTGVFVGDDGGLYANLLDLLGVHDQVGIGVAEAFLAHDNAVKVQQTAQLGAPVGGTLLVGQVDVRLLYTSPSPRDGLLSRMQSSA